MVFYSQERVSESGRDETSVIIKKKDQGWDGVKINSEMGLDTEKVKVQPDSTERLSGFSRVD